MSQPALISMEQLSPVLTAFGLTANGSPMILKGDADNAGSTVVRLDNVSRPGHEQPVGSVVLKGRPVTGADVDNTLPDQTLSAYLEGLLLKESPGLLPPRLLTVESAALTWQDPAQKTVWSASLYIDGTGFDWLTNSPQWKQAHAHSAGELLAKIHCAGRTVIDQLGAENKHKLRSIVPTLADCAQILQENTDRSFLDLALIEQLSETIKQAVDAITCGADCETLRADETIVHGDYHPGNVLFRGETAVAAVDFDYAHCEHPLYDLAYAWLMFSSGSKQEQQNAKEQAAAGLLSGYKQFYEDSGKPLPLYLQGDQKDYLSPPANTPLHHYSVVVAYLLLLWTFSAEGNAHHLAGSLAIRMVERIQRLGKL